MDGVSNGDSNETKKNVMVIAATNRLNAIDAALLRPGRLQEHVLIGLPTMQDCFDILSLRMKGWSLDQDIDVNNIAEALVTMGASGADIDGACREACLNAIRRSMGSESTDNYLSPVVSLKDFETILNK